MAQRDAKGRVVPGNGSLNPGGRPKQVRELLELAREATPDAISVAAELMRSESTDPKVRLEAAKLVMSYGLGRPPSTESEEDSRSSGHPTLPPAVAAKLAAMT